MNTPLRSEEIREGQEMQEIQGLIYSNTPHAPGEFQKMNKIWSLLSQLEREQIIVTTLNKILAKISKDGTL